MPLCKGCGSSYDDEFKFCPHCGRAKPEPEEIRVRVQVEPTGYEEAILEIKQVNRTELWEYPFDWRPSFVEKLLGDRQKNWTEISHFVFSLKSIHKDKGEYIAFESDPFRAFYVPNEEVEFPIPITGRLSNTEKGREWVKNIFLERSHAWDQFNTYLINNGWKGITEDAVQRTPPFYLEMPDAWLNKKISNSDKRIYLIKQVGYLIIGLGHPANPDRIFRKKTLENTKNKYRYQRQIA